MYKKTIFYILEKILTSKIISYNKLASVKMEMFELGFFLYI